METDSSEGMRGIEGGLCGKATRSQGSEEPTHLESFNITVDLLLLHVKSAVDARAHLQDAIARPLSNRRNDV